MKNAKDGSVMFKKAGDHEHCKAGTLYFLSKANF